MSCDFSKSDLGEKNPLTENLSKLQRPQIHKDQNIVTTYKHPKHNQIKLVETQHSISFVMRLLEFSWYALLLPDEFGCSAV